MKTRDRATPAPAPRPLRPLRAPRPPRPPHRSDVIVVRSAPASSSKRLGRELEAEADDVIDLGAPRRSRPAPADGAHVARPLLPRAPNPRLYPAPLRSKPKDPPKRAENYGGGEGRGRRRKRVFRRPVPNSRLYRPVPPRPIPPAPPVWPRATWAPPEPDARLDTASRVALRLSEQRRALRAGPTPGPVSLPLAPAPQLLATLPPVHIDAPQWYRPTSAHFRLRSLDTSSGESTPVAGRPGLPAAAPAMDAGSRHSASPEDCSDGNETLSAPSEFLAEFLSTIMRRQYAEALKYCRLILQYEPHNATARGFYPLLQHKVQAQKRADEERPRGSSSEEASAPAGEPPRDEHEMMEQGGDSSEASEEEGGGSRSSSRSRSGGSCGSQSSLELDSSEALAHSSPSPSLSLSRRTERTDSASGGGCDSAGTTASATASAGTPATSRSDADDNGNAPAARLCAGDVENDNAAPAQPLSVAHRKGESASLRRLRAQFTCSIK